MSSDFLIDINDFGQGLQALEESAFAPLGSAREMTNMMITDRGGISPRPGIRLYGDFDTGSTGCDGFWIYKKAGSEAAVKVKASNGILKYYNELTGTWCQIKTGYTAGAKFDFQEHLVNTDNEDYLYYGNGKENYSRWVGAYTKVTSAIGAADVSMSVSGTLKATVFQTGTSTATSATTLTDSSKTWSTVGTGAWTGFYILITSGVQSGQVRLISGNTANQLTFSALPGDPGVGCTYEIRMLAFPPSGTLMVDTTVVTYSAIPSSTSFTITPTGVPISSGVGVTARPIEYPGAPRGNRIAVHHNRMVVGNVTSGVSRDASGTIQGSQSEATAYVSRIKNATDFTFASPRAAGEGDIISYPYGGGPITDIISQEDSFYVFKKYYIESDKYPTDNTSDILVSTPLKYGIGAVNRAFRGRDDVYFITADKQITSLGRVALKDSTPQTIDIGLKIKRILDQFDVSENEGGEFKQRLFFTCKSKDTDANNNRFVVYNRDTKSFEGIWLLTGNSFARQDDKFYFSDSTSPNIWEMFVGNNDVQGDDVFGISASWKSNWMHLAPRRTKFRLKAGQFSTISANAIGSQGRIRDGTIINFALYTDRSEIPVLAFDFGRTADAEFLQGANLTDFLGANPLGLSPLGSISDPDQDGFRYYKFIIYFPDIYCTYFSLGFNSSGKDQAYEVQNLGLGTSEEALQDSGDIKEL